MKKIAFLILVVIALFMNSAFAVTQQEISGYSDKELQQLNQMVQLELFSRTIVNGVKVPAGTYIIGEDIPAGIYRIEFPDTEYSSGDLYVYTNANYELMKKWIQVGNLYNAQKIGKIEFLQGELIDIDIESTFYQYTGLFH